MGRRAARGRTLDRDVAFLAVAFATSGTVHLVKPEVFAPIVPRALPAHRELILASGVVELVCAAGLAHPRTRSLAGWASVATLIAVYPANLQHTRDAWRGRRTDMKVATAVRLPLQWPMIRAGLKAARSR